MHAIRSITAAICASALTLAAAGCGGGGDDDSPPAPAIRGPAPAAPMSVLLDRVPANTLVLDAIDLAGAKRDLGLPARTDPSVEVDRPRARQTLANTASFVLADVADRERRPALQALDLPRATGAVKTESFSAGRLVLVATPQTPADIAARLRRARLDLVEANILAAEPSSEPPLGFSYTHVALGPGFVAITDSLELARAMLARDGPDPAFAVARKHLDDVTGARRVLKIVAGNGDEDDDAGCVRLAAGGQRLDATTHDLTLLLSETPDRGRVIVGNTRLTRDTNAEFYRLRTASVQGRALRLKVAPARRGSPFNGADAASDPSGEYYRCKGLPLKPRPLSTQPVRELGPEQSYVEESAAGLITARSSAATRVHVTCPSDHGDPNKTMSCTGTRRDDGRVYHYDIRLRFDGSALSEIASIDVRSADDKTGTIMDNR